MHYLGAECGYEGHEKASFWVERSRKETFCCVAEVLRRMTRTVVRLYDWVGC